MNTRKSKDNLEDIDNPFEDPVFLSPIANPSITPQGTTYEHMNIWAWLDKSKMDPFSRERTAKQQLRTNHLFSRIKKLFNADSMNLEQLQDAFICPLSKQTFREPVVASNGHTYERIYIEAYVEKFNILPDNTRQVGGYYPNRIISSLLEHNKSWLSPEYDDKVLPFILSLNSYADIRAKEEKYSGSVFGYSKWDKLKEVANVVSALTGKLSTASFFSKPKTLNVLQQGRIQAYAEPALSYLATRRAQQ